MNKNKTRIFKARNGFGDDTSHFEYGPNGNFLVTKKGEKRKWNWSLKHIEGIVESGLYIEEIPKKKIG